MRAVNCWLRRGFAGIALAHLQQPRIDRLRLRLLVDFSGAAPLQNHAGDARDVVPDGEVGDRRLVGQRELVHALLDRAAMVSEDLPHLDARDAVVDSNLERHLVEREDGRVGLLPVSRNQHSGVGQGRSGDSEDRSRRRRICCGADPLVRVESPLDRFRPSNRNLAKANRPTRASAARQRIRPTVEARGNAQEVRAPRHQVAHHRRAPSEIRTRPLSVPT